MQLTIVLASTLSLAALAACDRPAASLAPAGTGAATAGAGKSLEPSKDLSPLVARLGYEASHRPAATVKAEQVLDALDRRELVVATRRQFLGVTVHASYCLGGKTRDGIAIAACEYPDPAAATAGKAFMDQRFAAMSPLARRAVRGSTVLTITDPSVDAHATVVARGFDAFAAL